VYTLSVLVAEVAVALLSNLALEVEEVLVAFLLDGLWQQILVPWVQEALEDF
jgi:hypothetical protein